MTMYDSPIEGICTVVHFVHRLRRAVRPNDAAPKEIAPRMKSGQSSLHLMAARAVADVKIRARLQ
jgi:hypothetical protein